MFSPEIIAFAGLLIGCTVGSFLNVVIYRLPIHLINDWTQQAREILIEQGELKAPKKPQAPERFNIAYPASHCPVCKAEIKPWHNIPIISYVFILRGKCHNCGVKINLRYPIIEFVTGLLTAFVLWQYGFSYAGALVAVFTWVLISLTMIDVDHKLLPDSLTLPLLWLGLLANSTGLFADLKSAVIGAAAGYMSLWTVAWLFKVIRKQEGMGAGDFKLLAALGAWMGWQALPVVIIMSSFVGAVIGIAGIVFSGRDKNVQIPFGPYLAIAGWLAFFWGDAITDAYLSYSGLT